jgi:mannose-1-phosphate guanylyltransferase
MKRPFRALLLAAGLGTRLRPITLRTPKCLVPVGGEPLLARWLRQLKTAGCDAVRINTHYLSEQVEAFLKTQQNNGMKIEVTYEPELLGTAGTLLANKTFFEGTTGLMIHADNAMADDLNKFLAAHHNRNSHCLVTMLTFDTDDPQSCGIVNCDSKGVLTTFQEKVAQPRGNCANGALYAFSPSFLNHLDTMKPTPSDFSTEVLPTLLGRVQTWHTDKPYLDVGTPAALAKAQTLMALHP